MAGLKALEQALASVRPMAVKARSMAADIASSTTNGLKGNFATGEAWYNQLKNKPGVSPAAIDAAFGHFKSSPIQLSRMDFINSAKNPKLYTQRGFVKRDGHPTVGDADNAHEFAMDEFWNGNFQGIENPDDFFINLRREYFNRQGIASHAEQDRIMNDPRSHEEARIIDDSSEYAENSVYNLDEYTNAWNDALKQLAVPRVNFNEYEKYQRLEIPRNMELDPRFSGVPELNHPQYFETVLRKAPEAGAHLTAAAERMPGTMHFNNKGQIAHARGAFGPKEVAIDEIQSDPYEVIGRAKLNKQNYPEVRRPHGDMAKAVILQAAKGGAEKVHFPNSDFITSIRDPELRHVYEDIYDTQLYNEVFKPLDAMGIKTKQTMSRNTVELPPDVQEGLTIHGLPFAEGGLVQGALGKVREKVGKWTGISEIFDKTQDAVEQYYPEEQYNGRGDALRHIMASALAAQKYGQIPAKALGYANEIFSMNPAIESDMDIYNNNIGLELGAKYQDPYALLYNARESIEQKRAKTLPIYSNSYAQGGLASCGCGKKVAHYAQGGIVPSANGFMVGGLNLINPKSAGNGPLNVQWNTNNLLASARSQR